MTILPVHDPYLLTRHPKEFYGNQSPSERVVKANEVIQKVAREKKVYLLDMNYIFQKVGNVGEEKSSLIKNQLNMNRTDGVHPTSDGYRVIGIVIYNFIMNNQIPHKTIVCFGDSITASDGSTDKISYPAYLQKLLIVKD